MQKMKTHHQPIWLVAIALLLLGVFVQPTLAHPIIVSTEPAQDAQLTASPERVRVVFNEPLETISTLQLFDAQGTLLAEGGRSPNDSTVLELVPPLLDAGVYTVVWRVVGSDGHIVPSNYAFRVSAADAPAAQPTNIAPGVRPLGPTTTLAGNEPPVMPAALLRALMLLGTLGTVGSLVFRGMLLQPALASQTTQVQSVALQRWRTAVLVSLALLLLATPLFALLHTFHIAGDIDGAGVRAVVFGTRLGQALGVRWLLAWALGVLLLAVRQSNVGWSRWLALLLGGALLATFALSGHAAAQSAPFLPVLADWLHLAATALWVGGILQLVLVLPVLRKLQPVQRVPILACLIERFSPLALGSVIVLTISGTYAALLHLSAWSDLWDTDYGQALLAKLVLFGVLIALGAYNMCIVRSRFMALTTRAAETLATQRWQRRFAGALRGEMTLMLFAVLAAGMLTSLAPSTARSGAQIDAHNEPAAAAPPAYTPIPSVPFDQTQPAGDLQVRLRVMPASVSKNQFRVTVTDAQGTPLTVQLVRLEMDMPDMQMGQTQLELPTTGTGEYSATASPLSMVGAWNVAVLVRRADADDVRATFVVPVGEE